MPEIVPQEDRPPEINRVPKEDMPADMTKEAKAPEESEPSLFRRAFSTVKGIPIPMATAALGGQALRRFGPAGQLAGTMIGGGLGEYGQQKLGITEPSHFDTALTFMMPGLGAAATPLYRTVKSALVGGLGTRKLVADAAEDLLKKWMMPGTTAKDLYDAAKATKKIIPLGETAYTVERLMKKEINRMPLPQQEDVLKILGPLQNYTRVGRGTGFQMTRSAPVADAMVDVTRLREAATKAFGAGNNSLGRVINKTRGSLLNDLENAGVPEVKMAATNARKQMALEDLGRLIHKPEPGEKISQFSKKNKLFEKTFDDKEWKMIDQVSARVGWVAPTGFTGAIGRAATTMLGGASTGFFNPIGYIIGAAGPEATRYFFTSPKGQAFIQSTLSKNITWGPEWAQMAALLARQIQQGSTGNLGAGGETE